ncbi:MAG: TIGR03915 family putative DNA repair protein [Clostridia bacterium]|nr:TIGR03915 family putative DNA repair protein [Clostridia bacterium]
MPDRTNLIYRYDGSFDGLLTCVFESYARHETPDAILSPDEEQTMLFEARRIETDYVKSERVLRGVINRISPEAADFIRMAHLSCIFDRDRRILAFLKLGFEAGPGVMNRLADVRVNALMSGVRYLEREAHHYMGFVRFTEIDGVLASVIQPKNRVLPLIDPHFSDRFNAERFIIHDATHRCALMHMPGCSRIVAMDELRVTASSPRELQVQALWKRFHETIAVEGRLNPQLQRNNLPLRFRPQMTEFQPKEPAGKEIERYEEGAGRRLGAV